MTQISTNNQYGTDLVCIHMFNHTALFSCRERVGETGWLCCRAFQQIHSR